MRGRAGAEARRGAGRGAEPGLVCRHARTGAWCAGWASKNGSKGGARGRRALQDAVVFAGEALEALARGCPPPPLSY